MRTTLTITAACLTLGACGKASDFPDQAPLGTMTDLGVHVAPDVFRSCDGDRAIYTFYNSNRRTITFVEHAAVCAPLKPSVE